MNDAHKENSVEQRRTLLKGALAASSVVTMGYSGSALASFECVGKTPFDGTAFLKTEPPNHGSGSWAWKKLQVYLLDSVSTSNLKGVEIESVVYQIDYVLAQLVTPPLDATLGNAVTDEYVYILAYFHPDGSESGLYTTSPPPGAPASESCLASVNPGLTGYTYGG